ncbi:VOC family protein [Amycolatopsis nigrescens]|uniref:VOC family protein n=1 Tax=Amycolatopsis nigrescens TaxID=381445 RepID=UPI00047644AB|nr:VOC family protein [Amycolatopsis nigrescens]
MALIRLGLITLDCQDPVALAAFWAELLDGAIVFSTDTVQVVKFDSGVIGALHVPDYRPPTWPAGDTPKHIHLDFAVADLDEAEAEALRLGAQRAAEQPSPDRWRVMLDPAGHPFCFTTLIPLNL